MAKIPLLECLTRHSYRENLGKSSSPAQRPGGDEEEEEDDDEEEERSAQSVTPRGTDALRSAPSFTAAGGASPQAADVSRGDGQMTDSSELKSAMQEADSPEKGPCTGLSFNVTLLDWINVQDRPNDVESVVRKCFDSINRVRTLLPFS